MPLLSPLEVMRLKLETIPAPALKELARIEKVPGTRAAELVKNLASSGLDQEALDNFIRVRYAEKVEKRRTVIPDGYLLSELAKVESFRWGVVQGQLDNKIQVEYVRRYHCFDELLDQVAKNLYEAVKDYVICTWYNHWTTVIIEDIISTHPAVVPTLKNKKGIDLFFGGQPFDLKTTYMPEGCPLSPGELPDPKDLAVWLYENQGAQRFGADNRLFVVVHDTANPRDSWKIKRDIRFVKQKIDAFFASQNVSQSDEIVFTFRRQTYTAISKVLFVIK